MKRDFHEIIVVLEWNMMIIYSFFVLDFPK